MSFPRSPTLRRTLKFAVRWPAIDIIEHALYYRVELRRCLTNLMKMVQSISFQDLSLQRIIQSLRIRAYILQRYEPTRVKDKGTLEAFP